MVTIGPSLLRDVHTGIPSSGGESCLVFFLHFFLCYTFIGRKINSYPHAVSGGSVSLIQGSYEYYHYMHDGFDDSVIILFLPEYFTVYFDICHISFPDTR